jgi:hypothetical protein
VEDGDTATVDLRVTSRADMTLLLEAVQSEMDNYPGGQYALAAMGQEGLYNWLAEVMIKIMNNPADYGCMSKEEEAHQITMTLDDSVGWVCQEKGSTYLEDMLIIT